MRQHGIAQEMRQHHYVVQEMGQHHDVAQEMKLLDELLMILMVASIGWLSDHPLRPRLVSV